MKRNIDSRNLSHIAQLAVAVDALQQTGHRGLAAKYAFEAWDRISKDEKAGDVPDEIMCKWNVKNEKMLFVQICISLISYSSYFQQSVYMELFKVWRKLEPHNTESYLRIGLLSLLQEKWNGLAVSSETLETLRYADKTMHSERSAAALALAQHKLTELILPYDTGRIHVYPDITNLTTYVLLEKGDWFENGDLNLFRKLIRHGDSVLDLGANVGVYAISAALRTANPGKVLAIEPSSQTFKFLNASAKAFPHMTCVQCGVSNENSTGLLFYGATSESNKFGQQGQNSEEVDLFTVDHLAAKMGFDHFDIIKMDVEGYEKKVLAAAKKIIHKNSPIIFYEIKEGPNLHFELIDVFAELGYDSYYYVQNTSTLVKFRKGMELDNYLLNMIAVRPESLSRFDGLVNIAQS
jgi:FkbM family methyltransferase